MLFRDEPWPDGTPSWVDLMVPDRDKAARFYSSLFGWNVEVGAAETGYYGMAAIAGRPVAGIGQIPEDQADMPAMWTTYLSVSDVDKTLSAVGEAGGQVVSPAMDVLTAGRMAIAVDPAGAVFGLWQPGDHLGTQVTVAPGTIAWNECLSRDYPAAKAFYESVFGYGFDDMSNEEFTYAVLTVAGRPVGGIGSMPKEVPADVPSNWGVYFAVADADEAAAKAAEFGGTAVGPPWDTPFGRQVRIFDDQGVGFVVIAPNEQSGKPEGWDD